MSQVLTINNRDYIPAGQVGKHFGYTRDYILMLARDGKIDGKKIGHRWYVNLDSAKKFFETAQVERDEKKKLIREERKSELRVRGVSPSVTSKNPRSVFPETAAVLALVLVLLSAGFASVQEPQAQAASALTSEGSFFTRLANTVYEWISFGENTQNREIENEDAAPIENLSSSDSLGTSQGTSATRTVHTSLIVAPDEVMTTTDVESIKDSFSDDVSISIDPHNPDTGLIIPHFKNGDGKAYRFLMVPVAESEN